MTDKNTQPRDDVRETGADLLKQGWQHVAYFDEGEFHWMSGHKPRNCELYAKVSQTDEQPDTQGTDGLAVFDKDEILDEIAEAISDSFDVDWTSRDAAHHVVGLLEHKGLIALAEGEG